MNTNKRTWILIIAACAALAVLTGCPTDGGNGSGGGSVPSPADTSPVQTLASSGVVIKITTTNTDPRAAIAAKTGNYYWVYQADELIDKGTVSVSGNAITFNSSSGDSPFKLTLSGDSYTLTGSIPNSNGSPIGGLPSFGVAKSIKITGFNLELQEGLEIVIRETVDGPKIGRIYSHLSSGNGPRDISMELIDMDTTASGTHSENGEQPWTGTGNYFISFNPADGLPESVDYYYSVNGTTPSKYNIKDAVTTLPFSRFFRQE